jgi:hypothetical protein
MTIEGYEHECGLIRVQAVTQSEAMLDRIEGALGVASRHLQRIRDGVLPLSPAVAREIEQSLRHARSVLGVGEPGGQT